MYAGCQTSTRQNRYCEITRGPPQSRDSETQHYKIAYRRRSGFSGAMSQDFDCSRVRAGVGVGFVADHLARGEKPVVALLPVCKIAPIPLWLAVPEAL